MVLFTPQYYSVATLLYLAFFLHSTVHVHVGVNLFDSCCFFLYALVFFFFNALLCFIIHVYIQYYSMAKSVIYSHIPLSAQEYCVYYIPEIRELSTYPRV